MKLFNLFILSFALQPFYGVHAQQKLKLSLETGATINCNLKSDPNWKLSFKVEQEIPNESQNPADWFTHAFQISGELSNMIDQDQNISFAATAYVNPYQTRVGVGYTIESEIEDLPATLAITVINWSPDTAITPIGVTGKLNYPNGATQSLSCSIH